MTPKTVAIATDIWTANYPSKAVGSCSTTPQVGGRAVTSDFGQGGFLAAVLAALGLLGARRRAARVTTLAATVAACIGLVACSGGSEGTPPLDAGHAKDARARDAQPDAKGRVDVSTARDSGADVGEVSAVDSGGDSALRVAPLVAPPNQWTWTYIPGSACADGSQTGFAINPASPASTDTLVFLEGGGACWDGTSCWGPVSSAFYVATGYGQAAFQTDPQVAAIYLLNRANTANPFRDKNIVYIPYCTGDVFAGSNVTTLSYAGVSHETHFVGYDNLTLFLRYITATFPDTSRLWLAGDSAGGFGAALNFEHVQGALPKARVDVIDDSGQPVEPGPGRWAVWSNAWNMQLPAGCPGCKTDPGAFVDYYSAKYPQQRFGLISYAYDTVISPFMGLTLAEFQPELYALAGHMDVAWPDGHYFVIGAA